MIDTAISAGAILGILLSVLLAHRLTIARERRKEAQAAIAEFKDQFVGIITALTDRDANPTLLITTNFSAHKAATIKLLGKLSERKAKQVSAAWGDYQALHRQKASLGLLGALGAEITDPSRAHDPEHIYEVNALRRKEAMAAIRKLLHAADL